MTNKVGRRNRKKVPKPRLDQDASFKIPYIVCPFCNNHFGVDSLVGKIGERMCPFCKEKITSKYYDNCALKVHGEKMELEAERDERRNRIAALSDKFVSCDAWYKCLTRWFLKFKLKRLHKELDPQIKKLNNRINSRKLKLNCLARNSYYVSEWFLNTHFLLESDGEKLINAFYNQECQLGLWCSKKFTDAGGFVGEYRVFNIFLEETLNAESPLFGCRLIPNIYVPRSNGRSTENSFWAQIDLVILCRSCAFVVEIKNWKTNVFVDVESGDIYTSSTRNSLKESITLHDEIYHLSRLSLDQNSNHASWFYDNFRGYPFERIFEVTLFYKPKSFESTSSDFLNNRLAAEITDENSDVLKTIMDTSSRLNKVFNQEQVDQMADRILNKFGDLNQRRGRIHKSKVERLDKMISIEQGS